MIAPTKVVVSRISDYFAGLGDKVVEAQLQPLAKESNKRKTFKINLRFSNRGTRTLIVKIYDDATVRPYFQNLLHLQNNLSQRSPSSNWQVPAPLFFDNELGIVVFEFVVGLTWQELDNKLQQANVIREAGIALRELHGLDFGGPTKSLTEWVASNIKPNLEELIDFFPSHRKLIQNTIVELESDSWCSENADLVAPIHGDFQLRQFAMSPSKLTVLDWDDFSFGDPGFDVSYFKFYLESHFPTEIATKWFSHFEQAYGDDSWKTRWEIYFRFNCVRRACRRIRLKDLHWQREAQKMIDWLGKGCK